MPLTHRTRWRASTPRTIRLPQLLCWTQCVKRPRSPKIKRLRPGAPIGPKAYFKISSAIFNSICVLEFVLEGIFVKHSASKLLYGIQGRPLRYLLVQRGRASPAQNQPVSKLKVCKPPTFHVMFCGFAGVPCMLVIELQATCGLGVGFRLKRQTRGIEQLR